MIVAFHTNQLSLRGTEVSIYNYAKYNEEILGNESVIVTKAPQLSRGSNILALSHFMDRFRVFGYADFSEVEPFLDKVRADAFYAQKAGMNDGVVSTGRKTVVHSVFQFLDPHGDVYAYISEWLSRKMSDGQCPYVPYMVDLPMQVHNLRSILAIPHDAKVFGRYGGLETFNIQYVKDVVINVARMNPHIYFLFMNTSPFCTGLPNVIFLPGTPDVNFKLRFINTCDAMLHARVEGETFGLAIAEFSSQNVPVITWKGGHDQAHLELLGDKGLYYTDHRDLLDILLGFQKNGDDWDAYSEQFAPDIVMAQFNEVFLKKS